MIFNPLARIIGSSSTLKPFSYLVVSPIDDGSSSKEKINKNSMTQGCPRSMVANKRQGEDRPIIGLQDSEKVDGIDQPH